jgi:hypothetical protein
MTKNSGLKQSRKLNSKLPSRFRYKNSNSRSKEYSAWYHMIRRCYYPETEFYHNYGGRGITVCDRWLGDQGFDNFCQDMGVKPSSKHSLDRIDTNGNYEPSNCRWATLKEQARNRRTNKRLLLDGEEKTLIEWCEKFSADFLLVKDRLRDGWDLATALTTPKKRLLLQVGDKYNSWTIVSKVEGSNKYNVQCKCDNMAKVSGFDLVNDKSTQCKSCAKLGNEYAKK